MQTAATLLLLALALLWPALVQQRPAYFFDTAGYLSPRSKAFALAHDKLVAKLAPAPESDDDDRARPAPRVSSVVSIRAIAYSVYTAALAAPHNRLHALIAALTAGG